MQKYSDNANLIVRNVRFSPILRHTDTTTSAVLLS